MSEPGIFSARSIGVVYLLYFVTAILSVYPGRGLVVPGDGATTAANLLAHESVFRSCLAIGLVANLLYVALTALFYEFFKPVGVTVRAQLLLEEARHADAVIVGSGIHARKIAGTPEIMNRLSLDPARQLIAAQCSGTLLLAKLGILGAVPACTDLITKPWVQEAGVEVLNRPFFAQGNIATAGGCLASPYLAGWIIARTEGIEAGAAALHHLAPVGEKEAFVENALRQIRACLPAALDTAFERKSFIPA